MEWSARGLFIARVTQLIGVGRRLLRSSRRCDLAWGSVARPAATTLAENYVTLLFGEFGNPVTLRHALRFAHGSDPRLHRIGIVWEE
jgi:hypothetical protein